MLITVINWIAPIMVAMACLVALILLFKRQFAGFITFSALAVLAAVAVFFFLPSPSSSGTDPQATQPTQAPDPVVAAPAAPPADLTGFWIVLGAIGGVLLLVGIGVVVFMLISRSRSASLELKEKRAALLEDRRKALAVWQKSVDNHRALKDKVLEVETDWTMLFSYPALVDASIPQTRDFHRTLQRADNASAEPPAELSLSMDIGAMPYPKLVEDAQGAWNAAWSFAQHTGTKLIPRNERKKIDQILKLLKLAQSGGGTEAERSVAYSRVEKLVSELQFVKVPERAMKSIDAEKRLMIEGTATGTAGEESESSERQPIPVQAR